MKIVILRHGKPAIDRWPAVYAVEMQLWIKHYNNAGVIEPATIECKRCVIGSDTILCSAMQRSIDSAAMLRPDLTLQPDPELVEAGLPYANWRVLKLPVKYWSLVFRVMWLFGYSKNAESCWSAKQRARAAAEKIIKTAVENGSVVYVGHGIFNRLIAKELRTQGWNGPVNPGSKYWDFSIYKKDKQ